MNTFGVIGTGTYPNDGTGTPLQAAGEIINANFALLTGALNIYYGIGAPAIAAPQGSLYLRSDGSSTTTRAYINTNGTSSGWTNLVTGA
jgi:hypothetical protein